MKKREWGYDLCASVCVFASGGWVSHPWPWRVCVCVCVCVRGKKTRRESEADTWLDKSATEKRLLPS
jgi:hypothetical protein